MPDPVDPLPVEPLDGPFDAVVRLPGSKSLTNRGLVCAALAHGRSRLEGVLVSDDTLAMVGCLGDLGIDVHLDEDAEVVELDGVGGRLPARGALLDARMSGTTSRFVAPLAALGGGVVVLDGAPSLRARPMADILDALSALGAEVAALGEPGHLPTRIVGGPQRLDGRHLDVRGDTSSQFLSGLLLAAPALPDGLAASITTELVSVPYVEMTLGVMRDFGATATHDDHWSLVEVEPGAYRGRTWVVEPDASAASYAFAAAALCGSRVVVEGLGTDSAQGDVAFLDVLEAMGAEVVRRAGSLEVRGTGVLRGVTVDMSDISDTAQTLAAIAPFADGPTTVTGIGFIRGKETDRIAAVVTELQRLGITAEAHDDGFTVHPGVAQPAVVQTYDDHRMAMSFAVIGLRIPGVSIAEPGCVAKTFPGYWRMLDRLRAAAEGGS